MAGWKLATYRSAEGPRAALVVGEMVFDAAKLTGQPAYATVLGILNEWRTAQGVLKKAAAGAGKARTKWSPLKRNCSRRFSGHRPSTVAARTMPTTWPR